ncbi:MULTISPECIES: DUF4402 domain-containing protein [Pseudoalteromonas]|uniref:DUF4402 domain-containing protein n=1 Tax=Pseudoalteromonas haloplanktis TaxID=228 RepID=A0ABU1BHS4_PSEHA|nr:MULTISPECIES: DUF4402 domain-containing protein [Pseudoalteromonas]MCF6144629.1 hypothetical protein [Pseudoalteromonas mariniglutinosa NCIMB 1770]MDQ9093147.1 DUF4402 domain-containing protein [Pseudoalteromonas haloplanktis]TMN74657.1 DUF4402 domain-containing protein [Pseudoalteromonas sp. S1727]BDF95072.1 hypothetical protein KAN5_19100 [Pseudoalteromonas sp. KAN5]
MRLLSYAVAVSALIYSPNYLAKSIEQQSLDFGTLVIPSNTNTSSVIIKADGDINTLGNIYVLEKGRPAELLLLDYPAHTELKITLVRPVQVQHNTQGSSSAEFEVRLNGLSNMSVITDDFGEAKVFIGGTLITKPSSKNYSDGDYSSTTNLEISIDY